MPKPLSETPLYSLIEAGHLARLALLEPLLKLGLRADDDAVLFAISRKGASANDVATLLGLDLAALDDKVGHLIERQLVVRKAIGSSLKPGFALTDRGSRVCHALEKHWRAVEKTAFGNFGKANRKFLKQALKTLSDSFLATMD